MILGRQAAAATDRRGPMVAEDDEWKIGSVRDARCCRYRAIYRSLKVTNGMVNSLAGKSGILPRERSREVKRTKNTGVTDEGNALAGLGESCFGGGRAFAGGVSLASADVCA